MKVKTIIMLAAITLLGAAQAFCEAPSILAYQGRLKEYGSPLTGNRNVEIKLCPDETGNDGFCESTGAKDVTVTNGLFRSTFTIPSVVDLNTGAWYIELWVGGVKLSPRERFTSTPYSVYATTAAALSAAPNNAGVYVSTNMFITGISSATAYYGDGSKLTGVSTHAFKIGDSYGGGKVFWVDSAGRQVLISAAADQTAAASWSNTSTLIGAALDAVYAGKANSVMISTSLGAGYYAARVCDSYSATVNGEYYDDWYLPSRTELAYLYAQKNVVGGFSTGYYWSSTETDSGTAQAKYFDTGGEAGLSKLNNFPVRCVRAGPTTAIGTLPTNAETVTNGAYITSTQTFTGYNTFKEITVTTLTVTGPAAQARSLTQAADTGVSLTSADFGQTITVNNAGPQTVYLPFVAAADIGATITVIKLGAGKVTIDAFTTTYIADSTDGGLLYNDTISPAYASVTLRLTEGSRWMIVSGFGKWITQSP